jgi:hypothetical protein
VRVWLDAAVHPSPCPSPSGGFAQKVRFGLVLSIFNSIKSSILYSILNIWAKPPLGEGIENLALHHVQKVPMHGQVAA